MPLTPVIHLPRLLRPVLRLLYAVAAIALPASATLADESEKSWGDLRPNLFGERTILPGEAELSLSAPYRAEDPALVAVEIRNLRPGETANRIKKLTLIVDENPAPLAAVFDLDPGAGIGTLETRIRVNAYSYVRVIAEKEDGSLHMVKRYVKATGGCAAPASKNADDALASMGQMRLRRYPAAEGSAATEVQLQIRHPNYSGLQMDQVTGHYRPAHYISTIRITAGGQPLIAAEGAISLSENPILRFTFSGRGDQTIAARAEDTEGNVFEKSWEAGKES